MAKKKKDDDVRIARVNLGIFKQGHDLAECLTLAKDQHGQALDDYGDMLNHAGDVMRLLSHLTRYGLKIADADTHMILIEGPAYIIDELVNADFAFYEED